MRVVGTVVGPQVTVEQDLPHNESRLPYGSKILEQ